MMMESNDILYDVIILGGGTGGYIAAIRASQLGLKSIVIEAEQLGGTCLHRGCIASKAYLRTAEMYHMVKQSPQYGIHVAEPVLQWPEVMKRKVDLIQTLHRGVQGLMKKNKIEVIYGRGKLVSKETQAVGSCFVVTVGERSIRGGSVILATGSRPRTLGVPIDAEKIMTSDQALERSSLPKSIIIIGGGTIGIEWASLYRDCGVEVTVIESTQRILMTEDEDISNEATRIFSKRGIQFYIGATVSLNDIHSNTSGVQVPVYQRGGETTTMLEAEAIFLSVGREPNVENIYANTFQIAFNGSYLKVDEFQETNIPGVYAIGDVCGGGLAHVAALQGVIAVEKISGLSTKVYDPLLIPKCTYSRPEIASVGYTEEGARQAGHEVKVGKIPFRSIGKALVYGEYNGFVKIVTDAGHGQILGVHLIGPHATDLISESGIIMANGMNLSQWLKAVYPHPTLSEAFHEALLAVEQRALHY